MRVCPSCGFVHEEDATTCVLCGRALAAAQRPGEAVPTVHPSPAEQEQPPPPVATPMQLPTMSFAPPSGSAPPPPYEAPPRPPLMMPQPQFTLAEWRNRYLLGLGLGFIPVLIALVCLGMLVSGHLSSQLGNILSVALIVAGALYIAGFIGMIVCLAIRSLRPIGYGLLTMVVAGPIIATVACGVIAIASRP